MITASPSSRSLLNTNTSQFTDGGSNPVGGDSSTNANGTAVDQNVRSLSDYMTSHPIGAIEGTIMSNYNARAGAITSGQQASEGAINAKYNPLLSDANTQNAADATNAEEGQSGFTMNLPALRLVVQAGDKRIRDLTSTRDELILQGKADAAKQMDELLNTEQSNITAARSAYVSNLIGIGQESRAAASFRSPEQSAVIQLMQTAPDSGITSDDTLQSATAKYRNSQAYKNNIAKGEADINAANAAAGASSASAAQTRTLTGLISGATTGGGNADQDVQDLLAGRLTPDQLQAKYANYPGGSGGAIAAGILSKAQAQGYNVQSGTLAGDAAARRTAAANSGSLIPSLTIAGQNAFGDVSSRLGFGSTPSLSASLNPKVGDVQNYISTDGKSYPYKYDGKNWVRVK